MTLSFTKIFKKSENKPTDDKLVQQPILNEKKSFEDNEKPRILTEVFLT